MALKHGIRFIITFNLLEDNINVLEVSKGRHSSITVMLED